MDGVSGAGPGGAQEELIARIKSAMAGRKQIEVAEAAGIQPSTLSNLLSAKAVPTLTTLDLLARALGVTGPALVELRRLRERADVRNRRIDGYLAAALAAARDHPYAGVLPGTAPPLAAVYVRQRVRRSQAREATWVGEAVAPPADELPADEVLAGGRTCVVMAGPGGGKSSLLRTWLAQETGHLLAGRGTGRVPVLVPAAALVHAPPANALADYVNAEYEGLMKGVPPDFFAAEPQPGAVWLVLVDGLDEVSQAAARQKVLRRLAEASRSEHAGPYRFVVATRPLPDTELDLLGSDVPRYDLQPFGRDDLPVVAEGWFRTLSVPDPAATTGRFLRALDRTRLAALAHVPLMTAMLCQLHAAAPDRPLPAGRGQVYEEFIDLLTRHQHRAGPLRAAEATGEAAAEAALDRLPDLIARLAAERHAGNERPALDILCEQPEARRPARVHEADWRAFLDTAARRSGLLVARGGDLVFLHQTLLEHLAARHAVRDRRAGVRAIRRAFHRYHFCNPGLPLTPYAPGTPPGVWPRVWLLRYWQPPEDISYVAFLLDAAHGAGLDPRRSPLRRLASRGGLPGWVFVAALARMGTRLPDDVVRGTAEALHTFSLGGHHYHGLAPAAAALADLGDPRGPDRLHALAAHASDSRHERLPAVQALIARGDPRAPGLLRALSLDTRVEAYVRTRAAELSAGLDDPGAAGLFHALAADPNSNGQARVGFAVAAAALGDTDATSALRILIRDTDACDRLHLAAAEGLTGLGDPGGPGALAAVARCARANAYSRLRAARVLAASGDRLGTDVLHELGRSPDFPLSDQLHTAHLLAGHDPERAADVFHALALDLEPPPNDGPAGSGPRPRGSDGTHRQRDRVAAARELAALGDPRAPGILQGILDDPEVDGLPRVTAAAALAGLGHPGAADHLHALVWSVRHTLAVRMEAALALAGAGDRRSTHALHLLARCPKAWDPSRVAAARALVSLGDPGAADLLRALPALFDPQLLGDHRQEFERLLEETGNASSP
ncbi:helix-turn-helix domain-containing protein [Streptomyces sp. NPDC091371]|uniref:NACHT domain-containing protein n=1 Tax=Streptomyces sp. NPDC091371 TaxID=3155303 RepID=UPI00342B2847